jgi:hypothetical protein
MRVEDTDTAVMEEQDDMNNAEKEWSTPRKSENTFKEILKAIEDSLSDLASSDDEEDGKDKEDEEDPELGKLSDDYEPGWVLGTISKTWQHRMESFRPKQLRIDELTKPGREESADYFRGRDRNYGTAKLMVPAVVNPQVDTTATIP